MTKSNRLFRISHTAMQLALALGAVVMLGVLDAATPASAQGAWCAYYHGPAGGTNCGFYTYGQCRAASPPPRRKLRRQYRDYEVARFGLPRSRHRRRIVRALGCDCRGGITGLAPIPGGQAPTPILQRSRGLLAASLPKDATTYSVSRYRRREPACAFLAALAVPVPVVTAVAKAAPCVGRPRLYG